MPVVVVCVVWDDVVLFVVLFMVVIVAIDVVINSPFH